MGKAVHIIDEHVGGLVLCRACGWVDATYQGGRPKCSVARRKQREYKEGETRRFSTGYVGVMRNGSWVRVHREVMEQKLGRALLPGETVHHVNGVRDDNRPENLELWVSHQPAGQRPEDLVTWAKEILERYA